MCVRACGEVGGVGLVAGAELVRLKKGLLWFRD